MGIHDVVRGAVIVIGVVLIVVLVVLMIVDTPTESLFPEPTPTVDVRDRVTNEGGSLEKALASFFHGCAGNDSGYSSSTKRR